MDSTLLIGGGIILLIVIYFVARYRRGNRSVDVELEGLCRKMEVPNRPFDLNAAVREVEAGTRPGIPRDGRWWMALGLGQAGYPSRTRLVEETTAQNEQEIYAQIERMFQESGGRDPVTPSIAESRFVGSMKGAHPDIVYARITGRMRPIEAWLVAVPPSVIVSGMRH